MGCDLILGMQWLRTLGAITWDCLNLTIEFFKDGQKIKLTARKEGRSQLLTKEKAQKNLRELHTYMIQVISWQIDCCTLTLEEESPDTARHSHCGMNTQICSRVDDAITLQEGAYPVNLRPYKYLVVQKEVIKA